MGENKTLKNDSIVISGISGTYPQSKNVIDLEHVLYKKINPISKADNIWKRTVPEIPEYVGQVPEWDRFDAQFCKVNNRLAKYIDPMTRKFLEHSYQALYDAGINPLALKSRKVGVYVGVGISEAEKILYAKLPNGFGLQGTLKALNANRVSYYLGLVGPSMTFDQMCSSSITALEQAFQALLRGDIDGALVGGCNMCIRSQIAIVHERAIGLSKDNKTRSFDENANGYIRSDGINCIFLQKAKDANRVYAEIIYAKTDILSSKLSPNYDKCDKEKLKTFLNEFYKYVNVNPIDVEYVEAFGCANKDIDKIELEVIDEIFNKERKSPVAVGSVLSNVGYTGPASGLTSLMKILIGYHKGILASNLHYEKPRQDVDAIREGRIKILGDHQTFKRNSYTALNNMSMTGCFGHVLLKEHFKPKDDNLYVSTIPYIVVLSGRQEDSVARVIDDLSSRPVDPEEIALLHNIHSKNIFGHLARGYVILDKTKDKNEMLAKRVSPYKDVTKQLWFVYSGMGSQWTGMGRDFLRLPMFAATINRCQNALNETEINLIDIITSNNPDEDILKTFVAIIAIQIALTDILREIGIVPDKFIGHSLGELSCSYADGSTSLEEVMLVAYMRGKLSVEFKFIRGLMAAVGLGFREISKLVPSEIDIACHNGPDSSTISGPEDIVRDFMKTLKKKNIFVKEVNSLNIAFHSRYVASAGPRYLAELKNIIRHPKLRSDKWISTSVPQEHWNEELALYSSAEYHSHNLLNPVLFEEAMTFIPRDAVVLEVAPHGLLQAILRRSLSPDCTILSLTQRYNNNNVKFILETFGRLYTEGYNVNLQALYPKVEFPVSSETKYLSHLVHWYHEGNYLVPFDKNEIRKKASCCNYKISVHDEEYSYLRGYVMQGINIYPFAAALVAVWDTFAMINGVPKRELSVKFNDVHLFHQPSLHDNNLLRLTVSILRSCGRFEVISDDVKVASGTIIGNTCNHINDIVKSHRTQPIDDSDAIKIGDVYEEFKQRGYCFSKEFQIIDETNEKFTDAKIVWNNSWVTFIDGMLQLNILKRDYTAVSSPIFIRELRIDVEEHNREIVRSNEKLDMYLNDVYTKSGGISIFDVKFRDAPKLCIEKALRDITQAKLNKNEKKKDYVLQCAYFGDFNSLYWQEFSPKASNKDHVLVDVHYASINLKDVKFVNGVIPYNNSESKAFGMDFSGITQNGERVMGIVPYGSLCTQLSINPDFIWPVPKHWTLEDAATIPLAYVQALYYLILKGKMRSGMKILVHGGSGALGQAVISVALAYNCEVFTTVSDVDKKKFLLKLYPELKEHNIGYSGNDNFADIILSITEGKGCDIVINNISTSRKNASINCCRRKLIQPIHNLKEEHYDLELFCLFYVKSYVLADFTSIFREDYSSDFERIRQLMVEGISSGWVRPLSRVTFAGDEASRAFRLLATSKHRGRVLIKMNKDILPSLIPETKRIHDNVNANNEMKLKINTQFKTLEGVISYIDFDELNGSLDLIAVPTLVSNGKLDEEFYSNEAYVCIIPGLEGHYCRFKNISERLKIPAVVLQPALGSLSVQQQAHLLSQVLLNKVGLKKEFYIIGYEYGSLIAVELAAVLESKGFTGTVFCIGDPESVKYNFKEYIDQFKSGKELEEDLILHIASLLTTKDLARLKIALGSCRSWSQRVETSVQLLRKQLSLSVQYMIDVMESMYCRVVEASEFDMTPRHLYSKIIFLQTQSAITSNDLKRLSQQSIVCYQLNTPLSQATNDLRCASIINKHLSKDLLRQFESKNICESYTLWDNSLLNIVIE